MSTAVAFLSGKGGSGKTTLALSVADLLYRCDVKTLLIDCDLSTNGATYFYESQLYERNSGKPQKVSSFSDVLDIARHLDEPEPLKINDKLDFLPSVSEISDKCLVGSMARLEESARPEEPVGSRIHRFLNWARRRYEVILLDCQAGYSEFLPIVLPQMDADLFVLEADGISASALRSLHLKTGNYFGGARLYQVFNKATPEEYDIYSKIVATFFTNIGTLLFDWKIRQAFSRSKIPDLESTSADFGQSLCEVCNVIFEDKDIRDSIDRFATRLQYQQLEEERERVEKEMRERESRERFPKRLPLVIVQYILLALGGFCCIIALPLDAVPTLINYLVERLRDPSGVHELPIVYYVVMACIVTLPMVAIFYTRDAKKTADDIKRRERSEYEQRLKKINKKLEGLEARLASSKDMPRST